MSACLALNASFEPLTMVRTGRAVRLVLDGKAEVVESDNERKVRSKGVVMPVPTVIRLKTYVYVPRRFRRKVTNTFLFARDDYTCQYCGRHESKLGRKNGRDEVLEREHVIPRSRGGEDSWTNVVAACTTCNSRKANKTPAEAGLTLLKQPTEPHFVHLAWTVRRLTEAQRRYIGLFFGEEVVKQLEHLK